MKIQNIVLLFFIFIGISSSTILINSYDGRDVVTGTYYAAVIKDDAYFIPTESTIEMIISKLKPVDSDSIILINGKKMVMPNLKSLLESKGYNITRVINSQNPYETNVKIGEELKGTAKGYVVVSPNVGYNSVAPIPYAITHNYYLLFAEPSELNAISRITNGENVLIYGYINDSIKEAINGNVEEINKGDKYLNNIELAKKLIKEGKEQVILTDGNFLEYTIMNTPYPIVFISTIVPKNVKDFIKDEVNSGDVKVCLIIGQEYINTAYNLKRTINKELGGQKLSVFAKLGESYPSLSPKIYPTPIFVLPSPHSSLSVDKINFNKNGNLLTIVLKNSGNVVGYYTYSVKVYAGDETIATFGSDEILELKPGETYTIEKNISVGKDFEGSIVADVEIIYGTSKTVLDNGYARTFNVTTIVFNDTSLLKIKNANYYPDKSLLTFELSNVGNVKTYYKATIIYKEDGNDVEIEDSVKEIESGKSKVLRYDGVDINSKDIKIVVKYGAKKYSLKKRIEIPVKVESFDYMFVIFAVLLLLIIVITIKYYLFPLLNNKKANEEELKEEDEQEARKKVKKMSKGKKKRSNK